MIDPLDWWLWGVIAIDLVVVVAAICALRYIAGLLFGVDSRDELAEKDNFAFGIALAGGTTAVALILAGAVSGEAGVNWAEELLTVLLYAVTGLLLLKIGILINDALIFHKFSLRSAIGENNVAAGTVQAANLLALGVLVHGAIDWAEGINWQSLMSVAIVFFLAQIVLLGVTRLRSAIYARRHDGAALQLALEGGNAALAIRYAGHLLGTALAASSAGGMVAYLPGTAAEFAITYATWLAWAVVLAVALSVLSIIAQRVVLMGIDLVEEVDEQRNIGVAAIEAAIFIGFGLVITGVLG